MLHRAAWAHCALTLTFSAVFAVLAAVAAAAPAAVVLHDTEIVVDDDLYCGTAATVHIATYGATDLFERHPLAAANVSVKLEPTGQGAQAAPTPVLASARTGADGGVDLRVPIPRDLTPGRYALVVQTRSAHGSHTARQPVTVADPTQLHVRTDRGVYRPGQRLRWRATALNVANAHPIADAEIAVEIRDPNDTAIWRGDARTDATGMVHGEIPLGEDLELGHYSITARVGDHEQSETVRVRAYELPAFVVGIEPDKPGPYRPGDVVTGYVTARYPHGEPVAGTARLSADITAQFSRRSDDIANGALDSHGRHRFSVKVPDDATKFGLSASVTDGAHRRHELYLPLDVRQPSLHIAVVPERATLAPGRRQWVTVITTDGHGALAPARLDVRAGGARHRLDSRGAIRVPITTPKRGSVDVAVEARAGADRTSETQSLRVDAGPERWTRVHEAIISNGAEGGVIEVSGRWANAAGPLVITLLRRDSAVTTVTARADASGFYRARLTPPVGVFGLTAVRVTEPRWDDRGRSKTASAQASVYIRPATLDIDIDGTGRFRPGAHANLSVTVRDAAGRAAAGVGIAASVVDERVLALSQARPDLAHVLRGLDVDNAKAAGIAFTALLDGPQTGADGAATQAALRAIIEALPPAAPAPNVQSTGADRVRVEIGRIDAAADAVYQTLLTRPRRLGAQKADGSWTFADPLDRVLAWAGWSQDRRETPWRRATDWGYARRLRPSLEFAPIARSIADERLMRLRKAVKQQRLAIRSPHSLTHLVAQGKIARYLALDPWGQRVRLDPEMVTENDKKVRMWNLRSAGPDRAFDTDDDRVEYDVLDQTIGYGSHGVGYGGGGSASFGGRGSRAPQVRIGSAALRSDDMAVRKRFDQTVLWVTGVRTDSAGQAALPVHLADSITGWEVAIEALGPQGAVGAAKARLETSLPAFIDVTPPDHLTVGDRYALPIVVANHGAEPRSFTVGVRVSDSLEAAGPVTPARLTLPAGATALVTAPVRARDLGDGTIDLTLSDPRTGVIDRVQKKLPVQAPGSIVRTAARPSAAGDGAGSADSADGADGADGTNVQRFAFQLPADHARGTASGTLRLFRGALDIAMDGIEGMLREPHGCFEQTSSTTYPNLLVLDLLGDDPAHADTRERARDLVAKGYQRLISYEVDGGGFSWFGEAPANQVLTAYGLMEFADMSRVYPVDPDLIQRTQRWLLSKQARDGSWKPDESWLHDWSAVQGAVSTTAYIAWAMAESGHRGPALDRALAFLSRNRAQLAKDPYLNALWAAAEARAGVRDAYSLRTLARRGERIEDGLVVRAGGRNLFYASGQQADAQVTALAALALGRASGGRGSKASDAHAALRWLWTARSPNYGWGTTQGTVLALRAATELARPTRSGRAAGKADGSQIATVKLDGRVIGRIDVSAPELPSLDLGARVGAVLASGRHEIEVSGAADLDGELRLQWRGGATPIAEAHGLAVSLTSDSAPVAVGHSKRMTATLRNPGADAIPMPTVIVPVPPGFHADARSLQKLVSSGVIERFEDNGTALHFYLTALAPKAEVALSYALEAVAACDVTQRPVQAYAYYDPRIRGASAATRLTATPRPR